MMWKNPQFWWLWGLSGVLEMTKLLLFVITPLWMFRVTHSAVFVALVPLADMAALVVTGSVGGRWADRAPRRLMLLSVAGTTALTGIIWGTANLWRGGLLLLATFGLYGGLRLASLGRTVLTNRGFRDQLVTMNSAVGLIHSVAKVVGPLLGGAVFLFLGVRGALAVALALQAVLWGVAAIFPSAASEASTVPVSATAQRVSAWVYLRSRLPLRQGVRYFALYMLASSAYSSLFYLFLIRVIHASNAWYPVALAAEGMGNVLIAGWVPRINRCWPVARIMVVATLTMAIPNAVLFAWPHLWLVFLVNPLVGMGTQVAMVTVRAHYQHQSDTAWVGQMLGLRSALANGVAIAGISLVAGLVRVYSVRAILLGSAVCLVMAAAVGARLSDTAVRDATGRAVLLRER